MNSNLQLISTSGMTREQWLAYRKTGVGASEVSTIMGLNPYKSSIQLFYEKVGEDIGFNIENIFMFMGTEHEPFIANLWQYWDGDEESLIINYRAGNIIRRCRRINAFVRNPKFPWLFVSLDRVINKTDQAGEGALEIKNIGGWESNKWEGGIPPGHVVQVQTQIKVCMFDHGELATLTDGRRFDVIPFELSKEITEAAIDTTHDFWQRIEKARIVLTQRFDAKRKFNYRAVDELTSQLATLEPGPDGSDAYAEFLRVKFNNPLAGERAGNIIELQTATNHKVINDRISQLLTEKQLYENKLKNNMGNFERLDFGQKGFVSWKTDRNGSRRFVNKIKE